MDIALVGGSAGQSLALRSEGSRHIPGCVFDPQGRMPEATKQRFPLTSMLTSRSLHPPPTVSRITENRVLA